MSLRIQRRRSPRPANVFKATAVFFASFALAFSAGSLTFIPYESSADSLIDPDLDPAIAITVDLAALDLSVISTSDYRAPDVEITNELDVIVSTNNSNGYTLTMATSGSTTGLTHSNGLTTIPSTTNHAPGNLTTNTWGYNLGSGATTFLRIPGLGKRVVISNTTAPALTSSTVVTIGLKADPTLPTGSYRGALEFTAVPN